MRRQSFLFALLILALVLLPACPRKPKPQPQPPQTETMTTTAPPTQTTETITPPESEFKQTEEPKVVDEDIEDINRKARAAGLIRDAMFAFDASTLDAAAQEALTTSASYLRDHPELNLLIEGHCDDRGTEQYNLALGDRRAATAMQYLQTLGIDGSRIKTVSYGEERPFAEGETEEAWAQNRRAHLVLVKR